MSPAKNNSPVIIGLAGPSCTGKSSVARNVASRLAGQVLSMESYYIDMSHLPVAERAKQNFDSPGTVDLALLAQHVRAFAAGSDIEVPAYDFAHHTRDINRTETLRNKPLLIVEGILILHWSELRSLFSKSIYLDAPDSVCFHRRKVRDIVERQRSQDFILKQYQETVLPMAEQYIYPTKRYASAVIDSQRDLATVTNDVLAIVKSAM